MPRNGSGVYAYPDGTRGEAGETIESEAYNTYIDDIQSDLNFARPVLSGGTGANNAADARENLGAVATADGTFTGAVVIGPLISNQLLIKKPVGISSNDILGYTVAASRWHLQLGNTTPEAGSNTGSDFTIYRYNDAGTTPTQSLLINRATGAWAITGAMTVTGAATITGAMTVSGAVQFNSTLGVTGAATITGAVTSDGKITANGDLKTNTGMVRMNLGEDRFLYWNGTGYYLGGSGGGRIYSEGNPPPGSLLRTAKQDSELQALAAEVAQLKAQVAALTKKR